MATRTEADLATQVLIDLAVLPEGVAAEQDDLARVTNNLQSLFDELAGREIVYVADPNNIPDQWFTSLSKIVAYELRNAFGVTGQAAVELRIANAEAIDKLRVITRGRPTYEAQRTYSF